MPARPALSILPICAAAIAIAASLILGGLPAAAGDVARGKTLAGQCAGCHGLDGIAKRPDVPHIAGESEIYLEAQLKAFRSGARHHEQMSMIAQSLAAEDIPDLIAWYASIRIEATLPD